MGIPAHDGSWNRSPGKMDADTYFWVKFMEHGKIVLQANRVVIGHMDLHIRWQCGSNVVTQTIQENRDRGAPQERRCPTVGEVQRRDADGVNRGCGVAIPEKKQSEDAKCDSSPSVSTSA